MKKNKNITLSEENAPPFSEEKETIQPSKETIQPSEETPPSENENLNADESLVDNAMSDFEKTKAAFKAKKEAFEKDGNDAESKEKFFSNETAKHVIMRLANFIFTGFNLVILNMMSKIKVDFEELVLTDDEMLQLDIYSDDVVAVVLEHCPEWLLPILHVEFIFIQKFNKIASKKKKEAEKTA